MAGFIKGNKFLGSIPQKFKQLIKLDVQFDDQIVIQSKAMGPTEQKVGYAGMSEAMKFALSLADSMEQPFIAYFDTSYPARREYLKKFAQNSEIQWCLETICNAVIRFNDDNYYMLPKFQFGNLNIKDDLKKRIEEKLQENFKRIYQVLDFRNTNTAWHLVKRFLVEGFLCQEIIYDRTNSNIIGFKTLDPATIIQEIRLIDGIYSRVWVQNPDNPRFRRELLDNQVIYISYIKANEYSRVSYIENMIRNFNLMRLMEDALVLWITTHATYRMKIVLPIGDMNESLARESLSKFNAEYKENVQYKSESGELQINGKPNILAYKNYIIPHQHGEEPSIEILNDTGQSMQDVTAIDHFYKKFQMDSKIPVTRFFREQPNMLIPDLNIGMDREEERFSLFIQQIRMMFEAIIRKPLQLQMCLDFPELASDTEFLNGFHFEYFSDGYWEERLDMKITFDRVQHIMGLMGLMDNITGEPVFDATWLAKEYLKLTEDQWKANEEYKEKAKKKAAGQQQEEPPPEDDNSGGQDIEDEQPQDDGNEQS
ncbi:MAG: portal protein, partial [Firmicutes bacterium]|nr:portal protein [Bacillota bacterium]